MLAFAGGASVGAVPLHWLPDSHVDIFLLILIIVVPIESALTAIAILSLRWRAQHSFDHGKRWFAPLVAVLFYPAVHGAMCKFMSMSSRNPYGYARGVSPWQAAPFWLVACAVLAWIGHRATRWADGRRHFLIAGLATPIALIATAEGYGLLFASLTSSSSINTNGFLITIVVIGHIFLAMPLLIFLTFSPWLRYESFASVPASVSLDEQQTIEVARHLEAITSSPEQVELR